MEDEIYEYDLAFKRRNEFQYIIHENFQSTKGKYISIYNSWEFLAPCFDLMFYSEKLQ